MKLSIKNCLLDTSRIDTLLGQNAQEFQRCFDHPMTGWLENGEAVFEDIILTAKNLSKWAENFVVCGIGGSALGTKAVHRAIKGSYPQNLPRLYIEDNLDPARMRDLLAAVDIKKTVFNFVSKSGTTAEVVAQFLVVADLLCKQNLPLDKHIIITVGEQCDLVRFAKKEGIKTFWIPADVGGRFSVFTAASLLPLAVGGVDIAALVRAANEYGNKNRGGGDAALFAATNFVASCEGKKIVVLMPYVDNLRFVSDWFCQLWGESLGKEGKGQTPIGAIGTTDQHSLLQLLMEGSRDKIVVFVEQTQSPLICTGRLSGDFEVFDLYSGKSISALQKAALQGVRQALTEAGVGSMTVTLDKVDEQSVGQLLMFFMLATAYSGTLYNIDPYDQPGVETGKKITKKIVQNLPQS